MANRQPDLASRCRAKHSKHLGMFWGIRWRGRSTWKSFRNERCGTLSGPSLGTSSQASTWTFRGVLEIQKQCRGFQLMIPYERCCPLLIQLRFLGLRDSEPRTLHCPTLTCSASPKPART